MNKDDNGGPAFPAETNNRYYVGMSLRDYFAAKAIPSIYMVAMKEAAEGSGLFQHDDWRSGLALDAYAMADAMLKVRNGEL